MPDTARPDALHAAPSAHDTPNGTGRDDERAPLPPEAAGAPPGADHGIPHDLPRVHGAAVVAIAVLLLLLLGGLFLAGWIPAQRRAAAAGALAAEATDARPVVEIVVPRAPPAVADVALPADVRANQQTSIYARTSGYLKPMPPGIDIGADVDAGQVIAELAAPEMDAQLAQARAALAQSRAAARRTAEEHTLAVTTLQRYESVTMPSAISQQDLDTRRSQESVAAAALREAELSVGVAEAGVQRLEELQRFQTIAAPFGGVITDRGFDAGALISTGGTGEGRPLFVIEQVDVLRVQVNVPQSTATAIEAGQPAVLIVSNYPGRSFPGTVARTAGAIDAATRTLRVEIDVPNGDRSLLPGMYGQVRISVPTRGGGAAPIVIVPTSALAFGAGGAKVAVVRDGRVHLVPVALGRDFGAEIEITEGVAVTDAVVKNPGTLADGAEVDVRPPGPEGRRDAGTKG